MKSFPLAVAAAAVLALLAACGPSNGPRRDFDGGVQMQQDPNRDYDGDNFSQNQGDCRDSDATIFPGADEICDGKDNDCDGKVDETCDSDGDGFSGDAGDCADGDKLVNPGAAEVKGDNVDNNCNGMVDEDAAACDGLYKKTDPRGLAAAAGLCPPWVIDARLNADADARAYTVRTRFGDTYRPAHGTTFTMLSTGIAADKSDANFVRPQTGTAFKNSSMNPLPMNQKNNLCGKDTVDPLDVKDYVELTLKLKVPTNANSFSFQFMFVSAEYPEFVGTGFNDKFLVLLDSQSFKGNIAFDANKNPITVNVGFFDVCDASQKICDNSKRGQCTKPIKNLAGTGYEDNDIFEGTIGGGTGWLTTTSPVTPGETATLRFIIFDEKDHIYDSSVILDNFQWAVEGTVDPMTIP